MIHLKTIDAHAAGQPLRLIVDGFPSAPGVTMGEKREWLKRRADTLRRTLMLEPRGHADMTGAVFTEPASPGSHAGLLFMNAAGFGSMSGHAVIAATTVALERGLVIPGGDGSAIVYDTPAGTVRARAKLTRAGGELEAGAAGGLGQATPIRVQSVSFLNVPSFVLYGGLVVTVGSRQIRADIAFGGEFYGIVDGEAAGLPLDAAHLPELRRVGAEIARAIEKSHPIVHPADSSVRGIAGTIFTGPARDQAADLRNVTVVAGGAVDRSPSGTGTSAVMAVIDAMGMLSEDRPFVHESLIGTRFTGHLAGRTSVGDCSAIVPEIEGSAWITGEHTFVVVDDDPLGEGFRL